MSYANKIKPKRIHQSKMYELLKTITGENSIPEGRMFSSLCKDQTLDNSQVLNLISNGLCREDQYIGFDWDIDLVENNREKVPNAIWYGGIDMFDVPGLTHQRDCLVIDADFEPSLTNPKVKKNLSSLLSHTEMLSDDVVIMVNVFLRGRKINPPFTTRELLKRIDGFEGGWKIITPNSGEEWCFEYRSGTNFCTYRTFFLKKEEQD